MRPMSEEGKRIIDRFHEFTAEPRPLLLVPHGRLLEFLGSFAFDTEWKDQCCLRRRATRSRTSSHG